MISGSSHIVDIIIDSCIGLHPIEMALGCRFGAIKKRISALSMDLKCRLGVQGSVRIRKFIVCFVTSKATFLLLTSSFIH